MENAKHTYLRREGLPPCGKPGTPERKAYMAAYESLRKPRPARHWYKGLSDHKKAEFYCRKCEWMETNRERYAAWRREYERRYFKDAGNRARKRARDRRAWDAVVNDPEQHEAYLKKQADRRRRRGETGAVYAPKLKLRRPPDWILGRPVAAFALPPTESQNAYATQLAVERRGGVYRQ